MVTKLNPPVPQVDVTAPSAGASKQDIPEQQPELPDNTNNVEALKNVAAAQQGMGTKNPWGSLATGASPRKPHTTVRRGLGAGVWGLGHGVQGRHE